MQCYNQESYENHSLHNLSKEEVIQAFVSLELKVLDYQMQIKNLTSIKNSYKRKVYLLSQENEETYNNLIALKDITDSFIEDFTNLPEKEDCLINRLRKMLESANEKVNSLAKNEDSLNKEIDELKRKITQQSKDIHHLREGYRKNQSSINLPSQENPTNENQHTTSQGMNREIQSTPARKTKNIPSLLSVQVNHLRDADKTNKSLDNLPSRENPTNSGQLSSAQERNEENQSTPQRKSQNIPSLLTLIANNPLMNNDNDHQTDDSIQIINQSPVANKKRSKSLPELESTGHSDISQTRQLTSNKQLTPNQIPNALQNLQQYRSPSKSPLLRPTKNTENPNHRQPNENSNHSRFSKPPRNSHGSLSYNRNSNQLEGPRVRSSNNQRNNPKMNPDQYHQNIQHHRSSQLQRGTCDEYSQLNKQTLQLEPSNTYKPMYQYGLLHLSPRNDMYNQYGTQPYYPSNGERIKDNHHSPSQTHYQQNKEISHVNRRTYQAQPNILNNSTRPSTQSKFKTQRNEIYRSEIIPQKGPEVAKYLSNQAIHSQENANYRPMCPFLQSGYCPSTRCIYYHPKNMAYHESTSPEYNINPSDEVFFPSASKYYNDDHTDYEQEVNFPPLPHY